MSEKVVSRPVLFLDFDGVLIPHRAYFLPKQTTIVSVFDPCATSMILDVVKKSGAKIVISSSWGNKGRRIVESVLAKNGISWRLIHKDWITPRKLSSRREDEIRAWLRNHPEVKVWVALDDAALDFSSNHYVQTTMSDGLLLCHYQRLLELLS